MEADIPPGFELEQRTGYLIDEAWNNLCNQLTNHPDTELARQMDVLLEALGNYQTRNVLNQFIHSRSDWWALTDQNTFTMAKLTEELRNCLDLNKTEDMLQEYLENAQNKQELTQFAKLSEQHLVKDTKHVVATLYPVLEDLNNNNFNTQACFKSIWTCFFTKSDTPLKRKITGVLTKKLGDQGAQQWLSIHDSQVAKLIDMEKQHHAQATLRLSQAWYVVGQEFINQYQNVKQFHRYLDFTDLEWQCYKLLNTSNHADWIQYKLDQRIEHLLVDEFQDTNPTQWQLILPLLKELAASEQDRARSVLFVGDSKQSIYRFRRAEPKLFGAATNWIEQQLGASRKYLNKSYRSSPAVISLVNQVFSNNKDLLLPEFDMHDTNKDKLSGQVCILPLLEKTATKYESVDLRNPLLEPILTTESANYLEAKQITEHIKRLVSEQVIIDEGTSSRFLDYGDILLLTRNRTHAADYERALREARIPYLGTERGTLLESLEVQDMLTLLQWLITPFDNHALAGILRSPVFSATDQDLFLFADKTNWYEHLLELSDSLDKDHPLWRAAYHLQNWRSLSDFLPVHDLLDRIYSEANIIARYISNYPEHLQSRVDANLTRFLELALENDSGRYPSLTRFISWLKMLKQQDTEAPDQVSSATGQKRVRILTIHESKGLEAPVVFLLDSTTTKRNEGGPVSLIEWSGESPRPTAFLLSPSAPYKNNYCESLIERQNSKASQEEVNLLYVALTRAKQILYICGSGKPKGWYQDILNAYSLEPKEEMQILEQFTGDQSLPQAEKSPASTQQKIDPRLQQPVTVPVKTVEIAPSYSITHNYASSTNKNGQVKGSIIHKLLEALALTPEAKLNDVCTRLALNPNDPLTRQYWTEATKCIAQFPEYFADSEYIQAFSEVPVYYRQNNQTVHGIIDRLVIHDNQHISILDYKSHTLASGDEPVLYDLAENFRSQLSYYHQGIQSIYPEHQIKCQILFTSVLASIEIPVS